MEPAHIEYYNSRERKSTELAVKLGYGANLEYYYPWQHKRSPYRYYPPPPGYPDFRNYDYHPHFPEDADFPPGTAAHWANVFGSYKALDRYLLKNGHKVYNDSAIRDKEYLFLFCELKRVPEYYEQVLNDKGVISRCRSKSFREINHMINSTKSMPESLVIAKKIVADNDLQHDIKDMMDCLGDICSEWLWQQRLLSKRKNEEFLLEFWEKNKRKPSDLEISETFCTGWTWADPKEVMRKGCTVSTCVNPGCGRLCIGLTHHSMKEPGRDFLEWLEEGGSTEEGLMIIEDNHKKRLKEPHRCRANSAKAKLQEAYRTGLAKEYEQLNQNFKNLMIPELDLDKVGFDTSVGAPVCSDVLSA